MQMELQMAPACWADWSWALVLVGVSGIASAMVIARIGSMQLVAVAVAGSSIAALLWPVVVSHRNQTPVLGTTSLHRLHTSDAVLVAISGFDGSVMVLEGAPCVFRFGPWFVCEFPTRNNVVTRVLAMTQARRVEIWQLLRLIKTTQRQRLDLVARS